MAIMMLLVILLISTRIRPAYLFAGAITASFLAGLIELPMLLTNFTNLSLITLVLLLTASIALEKTRLIHWLGHQLGKGSFTAAITRLGLSSAFLSSFVNNTAVVATLINAVKENRNHAPSKLLLPLSYTAILGGTLTLIGTSTNLIVNGFVVDAGMAPLGFFDFTLVGLALLASGLLTIILFARRLPEYDADTEEQAPFYLEAKVTADSSLIGKSVEENGLRDLKSLFLAEILRDGKHIVPVCPEEVITEQDTLLFVGDINSANKLAKFKGLQLVEPEHDHLMDEELVEVVLSPSGNIAGNTLKNVNFRENFDAAVIAIRRGHTRLQGGLGRIKLEAGRFAAPGTR